MSHGGVEPVAEWLHVCVVTRCRVPEEQTREAWAGGWLLGLGPEPARVTPHIAFETHHHLPRPELLT